MKVIQIDISVGIGSTGKIVEHIGNEIIKNGHKSIVAYGRYAGKSNSRLFKIGNTWDQGLHLLRTRLFDRLGFGSILATKKLINFIESEQPDIVHLHQMHGYYINIKLLFNFLKQYDKPVVWTLHDCWAYTGHCCHYERFECKKWTTACHSCPLTTYYPSSFFIDNSSKNFVDKRRLFTQLNSLHLVPVSQWLGGELRNSFLKGQNQTVIENSIDLNIFQNVDSTFLRKSYGIGDKKVVLGMATTWSDLKGLADFLELAKHIDDDTIIILVGLDKRQKLNLPKNIIGVERFNDRHILAMHYSLADVFANPSLAESFGLVTIEAMACGTPVVGYNTTATPELIVKGTGYVAPKKDIKTFISLVKKLLVEGKESYSEKCRQHVTKNYNSDIQYNKYLDLYNSIISD